VATTNISAQEATAGQLTTTVPIKRRQQHSSAPCQQLHHGKSTLKVVATAWQYSMAMQQLWQQHGDAAALAPA